MEPDTQIAEINIFSLRHVNIKDTFYSIAKDIFSDEVFLRKYNDLPKDEKVKAGEIVYIESKRSKGDRDFHVVKSGESMQYISQLYAIKIKSLAKLNGIDTSENLKSGENLWLKKKRPSSSKPSY